MGVMDVFSGIGNLVGGVGSVVLGGIQAQQNADQNAFNRNISLEQNRLQREAYEYNKLLNTQQMQREDTAIQRRMADLKAAGLSPLLAVGDAAGSSAGSQVSSPDMQSVDYKDTYGVLANGMRDLYSSVMQGYSTYLNTQKTKSDVSLINSQVDKNKAEAYRVNLENEYLDQQLKDKETENYLKISSHINDLELKMQKLSGGEYDLERKRIENEIAFYRKVQEYLNARILNRDYTRFIANSNLPSSVVLGGASSEIGKSMQDAVVSAEYTNNALNNVGDDVPIVNTDRSRVDDINVREDGSVDYGDYASTYSRIGNMTYAGNGYRITSDNRILYGGDELNRKYEADFIARMRKGYTSVPNDWLIQSSSKYDIDNFKSNRR